MRNRVFSRCGGGAVVGSPGRSIGEEVKDGTFGDSGDADDLFSQGCDDLAELLEVHPGGDLSGAVRRVHIQRRALHALL